MILKRSIAILLLVLYGVPVVVGPYWHHHDVSCSHNEADSESQSEELGSNSSRRCCHSCCKDHRDASDDVESSKQRNPKEPSIFVGNLSDHDNCAICDFYGQAQAVAHFEGAHGSCEVVQAAAELQSKAFSLKASPWNARGPPCCA